MTATNANSADAAVNDSAFNDLIDELTERLQSGKNVNIDAFVAQHAEHADAIRQLLPALEVLADLPHAQAARANSVALAEDPGLKSGAVGDFQILREIGRGGMGVVYEAKQLSLNRNVALKVLPFAATMDARQLQRFHHEAQAAAMLHHPHIVPVFGVGSDRGIHYYAMQLIRGQSLAQFVTALRGGNVESPPDATAEFHNGQSIPASTAPVAAMSTQPGTKDKAHYRRLAELMAHAANALEYAHSMGVIHRDVKPGNLLLDDGGHLWVTDFGLAKLESGVGMTMTGDLVGTLRYMSPEQALAKHGLVDHRTDVYSLGATLYELLTLRPPVDGADKHEVLRKIAFTEPAAPRTLASSIPFELETVTLKCMAKEPSERYASAAELAEDLRRFIEDRPVVARRSTSAERVWRWARRNPVVASLLTLVFVILLGGLTATYSQWRRADENAQKYRDAAEAAIFQQSVAQRESNLSWRAVRGTLLGLNASTPQHSAADLRRQIFVQMAKLNDELSADPSPQRKFDRALIALGLGQARAEAGSVSAGLKNMQEGLTLLDELVRDEPDNQEYREQLCCALRVNANFLYTANAAQAEVLARRAVVEVRRLLAETPSANRRFEMAGALRMWSRTLEALKRPDEEPRRESNDLCRQIIAENPNGVMIEAPLALAANLRDDSRRLTGNGTVNTAVELAREAVQVTDECVKRFPRRTEVLLGASQSCGVMAGALYRRKDWAAALEQYQRSLGLARELLQIEPANTIFQNNLNIALGTMAMGLAQLQRYDDAHRALDEATPAQQRIIAIHKERVAYRQTLYHLLRNRCRVYGMAGDHKSSARAAAELAQSNYGSGVDAADATLYLVQNMSAANIDPALSASERKTIATEYQKQALEYLKLADARGYADAQRLRTRYFEPLHGQPEFQTLLRRIAARASPPDDALRDD